MASYQAHSYANYALSSGTWTLSSGPFDLDTLLDDSEADTTFEQGVQVLGNGTFEGTYDFAGDTFVGVVLISDTNQLILYSSDTTANNTFPASFADASLVSTDYTTCFSAGTLIATPGGAQTVETLEIGDLIATADGRAVPVKWIGRQTVHKVFTPADRFAPVRVSAGALVNGTTISFDPVESLPERVTYHHVETEHHDVILANGASAETYVDYVQRRAFDNHAEYFALYGDDRSIPEMPLPRVSSARQ